MRKIKRPNRFKIHQNAPFTVLVFIICSAVSNRFKYRQNAPFIVLVFIFFCSSKSLQIIRIHHIPSLFSKCSLHFQIVENNAGMHNLPSLFSFFSLHFQIVENTFRMHHLSSLFSIFSAVPNRYK